MCSRFHVDPKQCKILSGYLQQARSSKQVINQIYDTKPTTNQEISNCNRFFVDEAATQRRTKSKKPVKGISNQYLQGITLLTPNSNSQRPWNGKFDQGIVTFESNQWSCGCLRPCVGAHKLGAKAR